MSLTSKVTSDKPSANDTSYPALFKYIKEGSSFGEVVLVGVDDKATVIHATVNNYPLGHIYTGFSRRGFPNHWERTALPITIEFTP